MNPTHECAATQSLSDFTVVATGYSQLAAVLAGFAFAGLIAIAVAPIMSERSAQGAMRSLSPLVAAFVSLVLASLNYGILVGEAPSTRRLADLSVVAAIGFAVAGPTLFFAILVLLHGVAADDPRVAPAMAAASRLLKGILAFMVPLLMVLLHMGVRDSITCDVATFEGGLGPPDWIFVGVTGVLILYSAAYVRGRFDPAGDVATQSDTEAVKDTDRLVRRISISAATASVVAIVLLRVGFLFLDERSVLAPWIPWLGSDLRLPIWFLVALTLTFPIFGVALMRAATTIGGPMRPVTSTAERKTPVEPVPTLEAAPDAEDPGPGAEPVAEDRAGGDTDA